MNAPAQILIVEDKDSLRTMLRHALERPGHTVIEARDQPEAVRLMQQSQPSLVLSDLRLPEGDGFGVLRASKEIDPDVPVIVMTAYGSIEDAVAAMKEGALDFLAKPVDPDHLMLLVSRALEQRRLVTENLLMKEELAIRRGAPQLVGEDPSLRKLFASLQRAAATDTTVLIEGESGTGKELFARSLHALSPRADAPFVAINCAAIPENLLETELFGYEKGAFTGAVDAQARQVRDGPPRHALPRRDRRDAAAAAGEDPARARGATVRARGRDVAGHDRRPARRGDQPRRCKAAIAARRFREDLVLPAVGVPDHRAAAARPSGRHSAAGALLRRAVLPRHEEADRWRFSQGAIELLQAYRWPGNVRELQNCIERAVILAESEAIQPRHLNLSLAPPEPEPPPSPWAQIDLTGTLAEATRRVVSEVEQIKIETALQEADGNKGRASELLQISYKMLLVKLREHRLE